MIKPKIFIFVLLFICLPLSAEASVFGDANSLNGIEDQRLARHQAEAWPKEFRSVGRIFCEGAVQGSAILFKQQKAIGVWVPVVLTAKHVFDGFEISDCEFSPQASWTKVKFASWSPDTLGARSARGKEDTLSWSMGSKSMVAKYQQDWLALELSHWKGWQKDALDTEALNSLSVPRDSASNLQAYLVGFDATSNKMVVHSGCHVGPSNQSTLLKGYNELYWDDCDSTQGSSGGALFTKSQNGYEILGLRVGSLFDGAIFGDRPEMGSRFDIDANINVTRAISGEMFDLVCTFPQNGCEPVGNNDNWVEN